MSAAALAYFFHHRNCPALPAENFDGNVDVSLSIVSGSFVYVSQWRTTLKNIHRGLRPLTGSINIKEAKSTTPCDCEALPGLVMCLSTRHMNTHKTGTVGFRVNESTNSSVSSEWSYHGVQCRPGSRVGSVYWRQDAWSIGMTKRFQFVLRELAYEHVFVCGSFFRVSQWRNTLKNIHRGLRPSTASMDIKEGKSTTSCDCEALPGLVMCLYPQGTWILIKQARSASVWMNRRIHPSRLSEAIMVSNVDRDLEWVLYIDDKTHGVSEWRSDFSSFSANSLTNAFSSSARYIRFSCIVSG